MPKHSSRNKSSKPLRRKENSPVTGFLIGTTGKILRIGAPFLFFSFFFFFLSKGVFLFMSRSPYFSIETVEAYSSEPSFLFRDQSLMGTLLKQNILKVDLRDIQHAVEEKHPELLTVSVRREFPNKIRMDVTPRTPVAQVQSGGYFLVDRDGVMLPFETPNSKKLPVITGVTQKLEKLQVGYRPKSEGLNEALSFLETLETLPEFGRYVESIDVSDAKNLSFTTPEGLVVKVGQGDYKEKLLRFDRTRVTLVGRMNEVKYIDLRFDEVVIGFK